VTGEDAVATHGGEDRDAAVTAVRTGTACPRRQPVSPTAASRLPGVLKVSVIIPTYASPADRLEGLVASLDRQTMPTEDFEVLFVDDGSPDDTWQRLEAIRSSRPNVRTERIENSGWPSRPRNIGIERSRGEYVLFMDHDDQLYPEALEAGYAFASANGADAVNAREVRTQKPSWALNVFDRDMAQAIERRERHPLSPMNPHKLYRRAFLLEHEIRFPEGGRVLWEDQFFNLQVARHARVISLLSSVPFYHWVVTPESGSTGFLRKDPAYWRFLREICQATNDQLAGDELAHQREQLMLHQYSTRVIGTFTSKFNRRRPAERDFIFTESRKLQAEFDMRRLDGGLSSSRKVRAHLLATGEQALLEKVCSEDTAPALRASAQSLRWEAGALTIRARVDWRGKGGTKHTMVRDGDRLLKILPDEINEAVPVEARDVTDEVAATELKLLVHSRRSQVAWALDSTHAIALDDGPDGTVTMSGTVEAALEPATAAMGRPLETGTVWDVGVQSDLGRTTAYRPLDADVTASLSLARGVLDLAFSNAKGGASVILDDRYEAVRRLTPVDVAVDGAGKLVVWLEGEHDGQGTVATRVGVRTDAAGGRHTDVPATLVVGDGRAKLVMQLGKGEAWLRIGDRVPGNPRDRRVTVHRRKAEIAPRAEDTSPAPAPPAPALSRDAPGRWSRALRRLDPRR